MSRAAGSDYIVAMICAGVTGASLYWGVGFTAESSTIIAVVVGHVGFVSVQIDRAEKRLTERMDWLAEIIRSGKE